MLGCLLVSRVHMVVDLVDGEIDGVREIDFGGVALALKSWKRSADLISMGSDGDIPDWD